MEQRKDENEVKEEAMRRFLFDTRANLLNIVGILTAVSRDMDRLLAALEPQRPK